MGVLSPTGQGMEALWKAGSLLKKRMEDGNAKVNNAFQISSNYYNNYRCSMDSRIHEYTWKVSNQPSYKLSYLLVVPDSSRERKKENPSLPVIPPEKNCT